MATATPSQFAALLRRHRLAAGLTQEELAERASLSPRGIQDLERGARRAPRAETVRFLADALALDPDARADLIAAANPELAEPQRPASAALTLSRPPAPPTQLIGREGEVAAACAMVRRPEQSEGTRLLTLTGPGGVGKTRLAIAIAAELGPDYEGNVAWVDLSPRRDPEMVEDAIAQAVGLREPVDGKLEQALVQAFGSGPHLLVVDNCEHLLPAMPLLARLLAACPDLTILTTSRTRLRLRGEREVAVRPLALPDIESAATSLISGLAGVAAVRLFLARAADVCPGFVLTPQIAADVAAICRRLDGLPLAIELAAAWVKILPPAMLLARLEQRLPAMSRGARDLPARQQTMRETIAWSYDLLSGAEQAIFRQLAVFSGGFSLDAAEGVTGAFSKGAHHGGIALEAVTSLVDQSLLRPLDPARTTPRFGMLGTIREYAWERLLEHGEVDVAGEAHAAFFLDLAERAEPELTGSNQSAWLDLLETEHDNFRAALTWSLEREPGSALRLAAALGRLWRMHGHPREGFTWLTRALAVCEDSASFARAKARESAGRLAHDLDDPDDAERLYEEALADWTELADASGQARLLDDLGNIAHDRGDFPRSVTLHEQALSLARAANDRRGMARALNNMGMAALYQGQDERAAQLYAEALAALRDIGDAYGVNVVLNNVGIVTIRRGDWDHAATIYAQCLAGSRDLGDLRGVGSALVNLGEIALRRGDFVLAAAHYAEARQLFEELGDDRALAAVFEGLGSVALAETNPTDAASHFTRGLTLALSIDDKVQAAELLEGIARCLLTLGGAEDAAHVLGAATALRDSIDAPVAAHRKADVEQVAARIRATTGEDAFTAALTTGRAWTVDRASREVRMLIDSISPPLPSSTGQ